MAPVAAAGGEEGCWTVVGRSSPVCVAPVRAGGERRLLRGSYAADDVTLLLTDLTGRVTPLPMEEVARLARRTAGRGHRGVVPVEDAPTQATQALFEELLTAGAREVALLSCVLARRIAAAHPGEVVIASIARAGTPVGVILHRLLRDRYRHRSAHYSISLVPGLDIDVDALRFILDRHPARAVRFVDGWSGKGGVAKLLSAELARVEPLLRATFAPELGLLADPGRATTLYATRDDVLIPSALLNATVSGLFSRSLVCDLLGPADLHGAVHYPDLAPWDCSARFVDTVCAAAERIGEDDVREACRTAAGAVQPDFHGWAFMEALADEFAMPSMLSFVKPGLNETCRALVARRPARVLVDPARRSAALDVVVRLARERGVAVDERPMPYAAIGLAEG